MDHRLRRREVARRRDLLHQRLDVRAEEFRGAVTLGANQVEMAGVAKRRLEARMPLAEIHLARDSGADHPLQRAVHRRPADARILAAHELAEIIRAQMPFLTQENLENPIALARSLAARRAQTRNVGKRTIHGLTHRRFSH